MHELLGLLLFSAWVTGLLSRRTSTQAGKRLRMPHTAARRCHHSVASLLVYLSSHGALTRCADVCTVSQFVRQPASLPGMVGDGGEGRGLLAFKSAKRRSTGSMASVTSATGGGAGRPPPSNKTSPLPPSKASPLPPSKASPLPPSNRTSPLPGSNRASPLPPRQQHSPSSPHDLTAAQEGSDVLDSDDEGVFRVAANGGQKHSAGLAARPAGGGGGSKRGGAAGMGSGSLSGVDRKVSGGCLEIGEGSGRSAW